MIPSVCHKFDSDKLDEETTVTAHLVIYLTKRAISKGIVSLMFV